MKKVLIVNGHPDPLSYNYALSAAYIKGASGTDAMIAQVNIGALPFNMVTGNVCHWRLTWLLLLKR